MEFARGDSQSLHLVPSGSRPLKTQASMNDALPRIVPIRNRIQAIQGTWIFHGEKVRLLEEPETGVLLAMTLSGVPINPMRVISQGSKIEVA